jgi:hypothetical protein
VVSKEISFENNDDRQIDLIATSVALLYLVTLTILYSCFLIGMITAAFLGSCMMAFEMVAFFASIAVLLYLRCKQAGKKVSETRIVATTMTCWTISRVMQAWLDIYYSRWALGVVLCAQQADVVISEYAFAFGIVLAAAAFEQVPSLLAIDKEFIEIFMLATTKSGLREALLNFEISTLYKRRAQSNSASEDECSPFSHLYESHSDYEAPTFKILESDDAPNSYRGVFSTEKEFKLYEPFKKDEKPFALGQLFKIRAIDPNRQQHPMLARVVTLTDPDPGTIDAIFSEAATLKSLNSSYLLPIEGLCFNQKSGTLYILMPLKVSLYELLH